MGKSCHLFSTAWSREMPQLMEATPVRILPWDFYNWIGDRKTLLRGGNYKMWNSGSISSLPCGGNRTAMSKNTAKWTQQHPSTWFRLLPKPSPSPALRVCLPICPSTVTSKTLLIFIDFASAHPHFHSLQPKKRTLMSVTSKHYVCFTQVLCPLNFFYAKVFL